ncbi:XisI protein [Nostoc sp. FACHB-110]|uniref:XisI protein n=1 Tax=Nostoc sp. FACHB-110 TaxID=2692834 RepID=UPI001686E47E|nr:XisI protein [Nostoc sp. FACHB-110]MBD2439859.1 XisI protein [Nostoc sp. FACHB-110]
MDTLENYRQTIEKILVEYAAIPYAYGEIKTEVVFDRNSDRYLLVNVGWDRGQRVHGCIVHIDIIDGKIWIQRDGTEHGIAGDLTEAGIPNNHIVLGFREPELRQYTGYATA